MSLIFRASYVGKLMASPTKNELPSGALTEIHTMLSQKLIDWKDQEFDFFTVSKGKACEHESIELYNEIKDTFYIKNAERITKNVSTGLIIDHDTGFIFDKSQPIQYPALTGECDLIDFNESLVIDIKTAYSKATYPLSLKMSSLYEWQLRAYMYLYDVNHAELAYCLVNTPIDLISKKDDERWHVVDDVPLKLRLSTLRIERDAEKENQLLSRIKLANEYALQLLESKGG